MLASVVGVLCFNFFFLPPVYTLTIADPQNWVALAAFLVTAVTAGQLSELAKRRAAEAEAAGKTASAYNRSLLEASLDALVTIGADGKINDVNSAIEALTGRSRAALIGTDFADCFTEPERARAVYRRRCAKGFVRDRAAGAPSPGRTRDLRALQRVASSRRRRTSHRGGGGGPPHSTSAGQPAGAFCRTPGWCAACALRRVRQCSCRSRSDCSGSSAGRFGIACPEERHPRAGDHQAERRHRARLVWSSRCGCCGPGTSPAPAEPGARRSGAGGRRRGRGSAEPVGAPRRLGPGHRSAAVPGNPWEAFGSLRPGLMAPITALDFLLLGLALLWLDWTIRGGRGAIGRRSSWPSRPTPRPSSGSWTSSSGPTPPTPTLRCRPPSPCSAVLRRGLCAHRLGARGAVRQRECRRHAHPAVAGPRPSSFRC